MPFTHTTVTPPAPTEAERRDYYFGTCCGQHARVSKTTGKMDLWWTGNDGNWGAVLVPPDRFVIKPVLLTPNAMVKVRCTP